MRVLVIHTYYKLAGGEDSVVQNEMALLQKNGHNVQLLSFDNSRNTWLNLLLLPFNFFSYFKTRRQIIKFRPEVIHIHNIHFAASAAVIYAARHLNVPMVLTLHNYRYLCPSGSLYFKGALFMDSLRSEFPWQAVRQGVYRNSKALTFWLALSNYLHKKLDTFNYVSTFIVLGAHSKEMFHSTYFRKMAGRFAVKPNYVPDKEAQENSNGKYFLYIGRLTEEKGIKTLLRAFSYYGYDLKIAGSGPLENEVLKATKNFRNITFLGHSSSVEIDLLLNNAKALIFPSEWYETFGMVMAEAFSKSVPVIASRLGNITTIVEDGKSGLLFEAGNPDDLMEKITHFETLSDDSKGSFKKLARAAYEKKYAPAANYIELIGIYKRTISKQTYHP